MSDPYDVAVDDAGNVWVVDGGNKRVLRYNTFPVTSITPNTAPNMGTVSITDLAGQSFAAGATVKLARTGQTDIPATAVSVVGADKITCAFDLTDKTTGYWNVMVSSGGAGTLFSALVNGFSITASTSTFTNTTQIPSGAGGEIVINPPSGQIKVDIPAGTFNQTVNVTLSTGAVPSSTNPTIKVGNICFEITNSLNLQPEKTITITVNYRDADIAGLDVSKIALCRYDPINKLWIPLPTTVDTVNKVITATTNHLSVFVVVQLAPAEDLAGVKAYPMPYYPAKGKMTIANLTATANVKIYTIAGELVSTVGYASANGRAAWDGKNDNGTTVASGVYIMYIESPQGKQRLKIAVEK
jgi:hypothetical protein